MSTRRDPEPLRPLDYALIIVSLIAWALSFVAHENGQEQTAWGELGVAYLLFCAYLVREARRLGSPF